MKTAMPGDAQRVWELQMVHLLSPVAQGGGSEGPGQFISLEGKTRGQGKVVSGERGACVLIRCLPEVGRLRLILPTKIIRHCGLSAQ